MIVKEHISGNKLILAVCDDKCLGKVYTEGKKQLDLSGDFYKGNKLEKENLKKLSKKANMINIVGEDSVQFFVEIQLIDKKKIQKIKGIPYAQMMRF